MKNILANLSTAQRISIGVVALLVCGGLWSIVRHQKEGDFKPLFTGLAPEDAAAIVQKLKETGADYRLPEAGGSVLVPSARLAELRLAMAALGLPKSGQIGFELFDKPNLGATEFTEHVNFRRALEGELERSVMSLAEVEVARVHLTFPKESVYLEQQQPAKASVLVKIRPGAHLAPQNVVAINHLVASAVEGLSPDSVSVLDMNGNVLGRPRAAGGLDGQEASEAGLDYRHKIEQDLLLKINSTLGPLLGENKFRAGVSVEVDFSGGEQSEEVFDPGRSVMASSQRTEDSSGSGGANGVPGSPSTLPRPTSRPGSSSKNVSRMTENVTYQTSRTVRKTKIPAGSVKKMSLAVLVDQEVTWQPDKVGFKRVLVPPPPEKLKVIRDLLAGITGLNADRGDQIVIDTLPFETTLLLEPPSATPGQLGGPPLAPSPFEFFLRMERKKQMIFGGAALGVLLLIVAALVFLLKRKKKRATATAEVASPTALPSGEPTGPGQIPAGADMEHQMEAKLQEREVLQQKLDAQALSSLKLAPVITKTSEVLAKHLREKVAKEPEISAQILRTWIREEEEN